VGYVIFFFDHFSFQNHFKLNFWHARGVWPITTH